MAFTFSTHCPICSERLVAEGRTSDVIYTEKEKHLREEHTLKELMAYHVAQEITESER